MEVERHAAPGGWYRKAQEDAEGDLIEDTVREVKWDEFRGRLFSHMEDLASQRGGRLAPMNDEIRKAINAAIDSGWDKAGFENVSMGTIAYWVDAKISMILTAAKLEAITGNALQGVIDNMAYGSKGSSYQFEVLKFLFAMGDVHDMASLDRALDLMDEVEPSCGKIGSVKEPEDVAVRVHDLIRRPG